MKFWLVCFVVFLNKSYSQSENCFDVARNGSVAQMEQLYQTNKDVINSKNEFGFTPLILACYKGNDEVVAFLISKKADVNYVSDEGTALMASVVRGNSKLVKLLLENKANPDLTNLKGTTALMYAAQFNKYEIVDLLLQYNANKALINTDGKTAFEFAVTSNNEKIINLLK